MFLHSSELETNEGTNDTVRNLLIDFNTPYDFARREVLYNILAQFGILMRLVS
jgi:hypothetical protein